MSGRRTIISNQKIASSSSQATAAIRQQLLTQHKKAHRAKNTPKPATIASYVGVFLFVMTLVAIGYQPPKEVSGSVAAVTDTTETLNAAQPAVDEIVAATVAGALAERANMPISQSVAERAVSLSVKNDLAQTDETVITKPQIIQPGAVNREINVYTAKAGDTVQDVSNEFGVSVTTIKWANNLTSDALDKGKKIKIPPVDGVIYTVERGDTVASIARKYSVDKDRIVAYNDLEITGPKKGSKIILPGATMPRTERPGYEAPQSSSAGGSSYGSASFGVSSNNLSVSAGNRYAPGYCTWYVFERRAAAGRPIGSFWGNAVTWAMNARAAGLKVNNRPAPGAIMQNGGGYGHVAYVESVDRRGNVTVREMNYAGYNVISSRTISAGQASNYNYIH